MATITVKNIPDDLYARLKAVAAQNRRSVNSEIISRIERSLTSERVPTERILTRIRRLQDAYGDLRLTVDDIEVARREGRP